MAFWIEILAATPLALRPFVAARHSRPSPHPTTPLADRQLDRANALPLPYRSANYALSSFSPIGLVHP